jgi:hypothetical protein
MRWKLRQRSEADPAQVWFAWYPVYVKESQTWVWLEPVIRRLSMTDYATLAWYYRLPSLNGVNDDR